MFAAAFPLSEIGKEKKYSKVAGSVNLSHLEELKHDLMDTDQAIADFRGLLKQMKTKPIGCKDPALAAIIECSPTRLLRPGEAGDGSSPFDAEEMQGMLRLLSKSDDFRQE